MRQLNHVIRLCIVLIIIIMVFAIVRNFFVPQSFGVFGSYKYGYYREDSREEQAELPALYQGTEKCAKCHEEVINASASGGHATVACETCHGYWQAHDKNTKGKIPQDTSVESCMSCHEAVTGRPADFPQIINFVVHMEEQETEFDADATCVDCHNPHSPECLLSS
jgi:hypothetical protein